MDWVGSAPEGRVVEREQRGIGSETPVQFLNHAGSAGEISELAPHPQVRRFLARRKLENKSAAPIAGLDDQSIRFAYVALIDIEIHVAARAHRRIFERHLREQWPLDHHG